MVTYYRTHLLYGTKQIWIHI